jgi:cell wall-associated NlpC family hydrolase
MPAIVGEQLFDCEDGYSRAVATVRELTAVRDAPDDGAEQVTQALPGEPLTVEETRDGWARVRTAYDYPGWIRGDALGGEPDPAWLEAEADDPLAYARGFLGTRYLWGGLTATGIDCSGLVHMSFRATGRLVPRDADQQEDAGRPVGADEARPGDLVTYGGADAADHIAFWLGGGRILHSTQRDGVDGVVEEDEPEELLSTRRMFFRL